MGGSELGLNQFSIPLRATQIAPLATLSKTYLRYERYKGGFAECVYSTDSIQATYKSSLEHFYSRQAYNNCKYESAEVNA